MQRIAVIGLGKLGMGFAAATASRGFEVVGVDIDATVVEAVNSGRSPIQEPGVQAVISSAGTRLSATSDHAAAIDDCDLSFVIVATPSDPDGNYSNTYVETAVESLAVAFATGTKPYHIFVIGSTLMPLSTEEQLIPLLERRSGRRLGADFGVCYVPDFCALGTVIDDTLNPDLVVIGESDKEAGARVERFYRNLCENTPTIARMSITDAEITKVSLNAYVTLKISFANLLGNLCARIDGADVDAITDALGADRRISPHYLRAAVAYGGPCFPRDTRAFVSFAETLGVSADMVETVERVNEQQHRHLLEVVLRELEAAATSRIAVLGTAFKPGTSSISDSAGVRLVESLVERGFDVTAHDPIAGPATKDRFGPKISHAGSIESCVANADIVVTTTPDPRFAALHAALRTHPPAAVIDCWRTLDRRQLPAGTRYVGIGLAS